MCITQKVSCTVMSMAFIILVGILSITIKYESDQSFTCPFNPYDALLNNFTANPMLQQNAQSQWSQNESDQTNQQSDELNFLIEWIFQFFTLHWILIFSCILGAMCCIIFCYRSLCTKKNGKKRINKIQDLHQKTHSNQQINYPLQYQTLNQSIRSDKNNPNFNLLTKQSLNSTSKLYQNPYNILQTTHSLSKLNQIAKKSSILNKSSLSSQILTDKSMLLKGAIKKQSDKITAINSPKTIVTNVYKNYSLHLEKNKTQTISQLTVKSIEKKIQSTQKSTNKKPQDAPYSGIKGKWVQAHIFESEKKTFGFFQCKSCVRTWTSAHSKKSFRQACQKCYRFKYATYLWENDSSQNIVNYRRKSYQYNYWGYWQQDYDSRPHLSYLCEACKRGKCND